MFETFFELTATLFMNDIPVSELYMSDMLDETLGRLNFVANSYTKIYRFSGYRTLYCFVFI